MGMFGGSSKGGPVLHADQRCSLTYQNSCMVSEDENLSRNFSLIIEFDICKQHRSPNISKYECDRDTRFGETAQTQLRSSILPSSRPPLAKNSMNDRPDRPLVVKCTHERKSKKISFASARNCTYELLKQKVCTLYAPLDANLKLTSCCAILKVTQCFALCAMSYAIVYTDDDKEVTDISDDTALTEAIMFFHQGGDDPAPSSSASALSGRSFGSRRITLRVEVRVDYDGPSLSDTSSVASADEYQAHDPGQANFFLGSPSIELEDDSVTISSRGTDAGPIATADRVSNFRDSLDYPNQPTSPISLRWDVRTSGSNVPSLDPSATDPYLQTLASPGDPSAVFDLLRLEETSHGTDRRYYEDSATAGADRGAAWIRDQKIRAIKSMLGALPTQSESDDISLAGGVSGSLLDGDLELTKSPSGNYYYSYISATSSSASQLGCEDVRSTNGTHASWERDGSAAHISNSLSDQFNWTAQTQASLIDLEPGASNSPNWFRHPPGSDPLRSQPGWQVDSSIPPEVLKFAPHLEQPGPPAELLTTCSECGIDLEKVRYICSTCGEKTPSAQHEARHGKGKVVTTFHDTPMSYPPINHRSPGGSRSKHSFAPTPFLSGRQKPLPSIPHISSARSSSATLVVSAEHVGNGAGRVTGGPLVYITPWTVALRRLPP
jgi:hypothetical protein